MKKLASTLVLFLCSAMASPQTMVEKNYYSQNPTLGGEVKITESTKSMEGNKAIVTFEVTAPSSDTYYASFWMIPAKLKDGSFAEYSVAVNGNILDSHIAFEGNDWQDAPLANNNGITLNKGKNTISVIGRLPCFPNVEHVRLSSSLSKSKINVSEYNAFKNAIVKESKANAERNVALANLQHTDTIPTEMSQIKSVVQSSDTEDPLYDYSFMLNITIRYTFYTTAYFLRGEQVFLATTGVDNFGHVLELFNSEHPENHSWSAKSNSSCLASLNLTIPESGFYYIKVRSYLNARTGLCNLNINGENYYENIPVYSMGVRCTQETDQTYNTFTCKSSGDPMLWIEDGLGLPGRIMAFNDNYENKEDGYFDWGNDARINIKYPRAASSALLSTAHSYNPTGKCDLYIKCKNVDFALWDPRIENSFTSIIQKNGNDLIQSSPASPIYNCYAWAGGITSYWEWPEDENSSYFDPIYWIAYTDYFASRGYTPVYANENNGVVALWGIGDEMAEDPNDNVYQHASIRKGADDNAHGYDWESKMGALERAFHPRDIFEGTSYGKILVYFRKDPSLNYAMTLEEEIADGTSKIEYTDFNADEKDYLRKKINDIESDVLSQFYTLYGQWKSVTEDTPYSSPDKIADCEIYRKTLSFCQSHPDLIYAIYAKLEDGGIAALKLIKDLTLHKNRDVMAQIRKAHPSGKTRNGVRIYRPMLANTVAYVKELLAKENKTLQKTRNLTEQATDISYSNAHEFDISASDNAVTVRFAINDASNVYLNLLDLSGNVVCCRVNGKILPSGEYTYDLTFGSENIYLVQLLINGRANVKKVVVNRH